MARHMHFDGYFLSFLFMLLISFHLLCSPCQARVGEHYQPCIYHHWAALLKAAENYFLHFLFIFHFYRLDCSIARDAQHWHCGSLGEYHIPLHRIQYSKQLDLMLAGPRDDVLCVVR
ncbi:hypothetical protein LY78DRAFT_97973 [Colletotrichum sublineola]|nr:hypothetical protein LY78DRAFT_97973 [Colletotrichum sublineola]